MLGTTVLDKCFQVIEIGFSFCLCGLSVYFTYGVLDQFISGRVCSPVKIKIITYPWGVISINPPTRHPHSKMEAWGLHDRY